MSEILHCRIHGSGERSVVLLHGLLGQGSNLESLARALAGDGYRVLVPDLRNHGRSFHAPHMDYRVMAGDVLHLLDHHAVAVAAVLGHSMGGKVAMQFAFDHPQRCERLIVADIAPVAYAGQHTEILAALSAIDDPALDRNATRARLAQSIADAGVIELLLMARARDDDGDWFWRFDVDALSRNYDALLAAPSSDQVCAVATRFLRGERSSYVGAAGITAARRCFAQMDVVTIPGAGHWLHADQPARVHESVLEFLR